MVLAFPALLPGTEPPRAGFRSLREGGLEGPHDTPSPASSAHGSQVFSINANEIGSWITIFLHSRVLSQMENSSPNYIRSKEEFS